MPTIEEYNGTFLVKIQGTTKVRYLAFGTKKEAEEYITKNFA